MLASLSSEFDLELDFLPDYIAALGDRRREISVATGAAAYAFIKSLCDRLSLLCKNLHIHVYKITNHFFGEEITVSGLLTGTDIAQISGQPLGEALLLPAATLRAEGDLFLCGMPRETLSQKLNTPIFFTENNGTDFISKIFGISI